MSRWVGTDRIATSSSASRYHSLLDMLYRFADLAQRPSVRRIVRYSMVSVFCVVVAQVVLFGLQVGFSMNEGFANVIAFAVSTVPSYHLNRKWAWGKSGASHMWNEVIPFWVLSFLAFGLSEGAVLIAGAWARHHHFSEVGRSGLVNAAALVALGVTWIAKFFAFNKFLFATEDQPAHKATGELQAETTHTALFDAAS